MSAEGAKNVFWLWLSPLQGWGSLEARMFQSKSMLLLLPCILLLLLLLSPWSHSVGYTNSNHKPDTVFYWRCFILQITFSILSPPIATLKALYSSQYMDTFEDLTVLNLTISKATGLDVSTTAWCWNWYIISCK